MPRTETVLTVMVSSPQDVADDRRALEDVVRELNQVWSHETGIRLELVMWETDAYPSFGQDPQAVINKQMGDAYDIFIGILWTRFGTPTPRAMSGTKEEFDRAYARFREDPSSVRIMIYFKDTPVPPSQYTAQMGYVNEFRSQLGGLGGLYWTYASTEAFVNLARIHLTHQVQEYKAMLAARAPQQQEIDASGSTGVGNPDDNADRDGVDDSDYSSGQADDSEGVLDLIELAQDRFDELQKLSTRMSSSINQVGADIAGRAEELERANKAGDIRAMRRVVNRTADDMNQFVVRMSPDIPLFGSLYVDAIDAIGRSATMLTDVGADNRENVDILIELSIGIGSSLRSIQNPMNEFRETIAELARPTANFKKARRSMLAMLDALNSEIERGLSTTSRVQNALEQMARELPDSDGTGQGQPTHRPIAPSSEFTVELEYDFTGPGRLPAYYLND
jgi:hypothetical protein